MKKNNGFTFVEVIAVIIILGVLVAALLPALSQVNENARNGRCKACLSQIGKGMNMYLLDLGKQVQYPQRSAQGFIAALYEEGVLIEPEVYLCPSTTDTNREYETSIGNTKSSAASIAGAPDLGNASGPISYAGRLNKNQNIYPGIFRPREDLTTTPIVGDDLGSPHNHENGQVMFFLFLDSHVDHVRRRNSDFTDMFSVLGN
ncbi:type II secretion system protein [Candidatus Uabimicrobium amorphum]|uniref:Prepilin-type N-terminal cleavage/methylation domain-containing protein n=1 Tax=Uabimicrobium amorphum TaxID=2596890 RepID=A0A5S9F3Q9_UABAM|nr:prepilin-type N-terminal cleavage/methylation domain-containing protein [Candidatus Uabimicrobium amorphum]BBM84936.1 prepilin-type N-terminal cleavage/methylation domain-containing protein [Candidatus Uabimicrobium amorphum]